MSCKEGSCHCRKGDHTSGQRHPSLFRIPGDSSGYAYPFPGNGLKIEDRLIQVRFKGNRKAYYRTVPGMIPDTGEPVIVESDGGFDLGYVTLTGDRAREAFRRGKEELGPGPGRILRRAGESDIRNWLKLKRKEREVLTRLRKLAGRIDPEMEICDVEFRNDARKLWIYYRKGNGDSVRRLAQRAASMYGTGTEMANRDIPGNRLLRHTHAIRQGGRNKPSQDRGPF